MQWLIHSLITQLAQEHEGSSSIFSLITQIVQENDGTISGSIFSLITQIAQEHEGNDSIHSLITQLAQTHKDNDSTYTHYQCCGSKYIEFGSGARVMLYYFGRTNIKIIVKEKQFNFFKISFLTTI